METRTRNSPPNASPYDEFDRYFDTELSAGERIGSLPPRRSRKLLRTVLVLLLAMGGGWFYLGDTSTLARWLPPETVSQLQAAIDKLMAATSGVFSSASRTPEQPPASEPPTRIAEPAPIVPSVPPAEPAAAQETAATEAPAATAPDQVEVVAKVEAEPEPAAKAEPEAPPERLPPPVIDQSDPYQRKATAVGLHPELSRALLEKLTATDYRNAGIAIKKALAETPDTEAFIWPRERKAGLALFQVKFVPGAPADCRRYVVAIVREGWQTTALPMERCDIKPVRAAARVNPVPDKGHSSAP